MKPGGAGAKLYARIVLTSGSTRPGDLRRDLQYGAAGGHPALGPEPAGPGAPPGPGAGRGVRRGRLGILVVVAMIGILALGASSLLLLRSHLTAAEQRRITDVVDSTNATFDYFHDLETSGRLTQAEAQKQAIALVRKTRETGDFSSGASPRSAAMLALAARARAVLECVARCRPAHHPTHCLPPLSGRSRPTCVQTPPPPTTRPCLPPTTPPSR